MDKGSESIFNNGENNSSEEKQEEFDEYLESLRQEVGATVPKTKNKIILSMNEDIFALMQFYPDLLSSIAIFINCNRRCIYLTCFSSNLN